MMQRWLVYLDCETFLSFLILTKHIGLGVLVGVANGDVLVVLHEILVDELR